MDEIVKILKVLSDKNRLRILKLLERRKMCVCELAYILKISQPAISRHVKRMKEVGLVADEQDGFWTNYYLITHKRFIKDVIPCINQWVKGDRLIKIDAERLKKVDRTKLCCT